MSGKPILTNHSTKKPLLREVKVRFNFLMILQKDATLEIDHTEESSDDGICEYSA